MPSSSRYLTCAGREIHVTEWGSQHRRTVIAWHGLARTGRDMDELAEHLSDRYRVICPDTLGRGFSQWSPDPHNEYKLAFYARIAADLLDGLDVERAHWVGTSMGGAIGTVCAAGLFQHPVGLALGRGIDDDLRPLGVGDVAVLLPFEGVGLVESDPMATLGEVADDAAVVGGRAVPVGGDEARSEEGDVEAAAHAG